MNFSKSITSFAGFLALGAGCALFGGWVLTGPLAPPWCFVAKANSALALGLCGLTLLAMRAPSPSSRARGISVAALAVIAAVAIVNLFEWTTGLRTGLNEIFSSDPFSRMNDLPPGRLTLPASIAYAALTVGLFSLRFRGRRGWVVARTLAGMVVVGIGSFSLLGYLYGAQSIYRMGMPLVAISPLGGTVLLFLGLGILFARDEGPAAILNSRRPGGTMARRAWPYLVGVTVALGWLRVAGERLRLYDSPSGTALLIFALLVVFACVLWLNARRIDQEDLAKSAALIELKAAEREARFLAEVSRLLGSASNEEEILSIVTRMLVPAFGDESRVDLDSGAEKQPVLTVRKLSTPIRARGQLLGALTIERSEAREPFTVRDSIFAEEIASRAGVAIDNTRLYRELASKNSLLDAVIESMPNGLFVADQNGKVLLANLAARGIAAMDLLGGKRSDMLGNFEFRREDSTVLSPEELPFALALAGERVDDMALTVSGRAIPEPRDLRVSTRPLFHENGEVRGAAVLFTDVTERRRLEEHRRSSIAELRRSNEDLQQFASIVSHDLQEPLRTISSYITLAARAIGPGAPPRATEFMGFVAEGARRMKRLLDSMLEFSRVASHGRAIEPVEAEIALRNALDDLRSAIKRRDAQINAQPLPRVKADLAQLEQLFQNLLGNAIKYCARVPVIAIYAEADRDGFTRFAVKDNGIGIDMRYADRIFQIFQRLHSRDEYEGTGVGLAVCKRIVERHGGKMWIDSVPGEGSTIYFTLPEA